MESATYSTKPDDLIRKDLGTMEAMYDVAGAARKALDEKNPKTLLIGTHPSLRHIGDGLLPKTYFPSNDREFVIDKEPQEVLNRLETLVHQNYKKYSCVMAAFELHHFHGKDLKNVLELLGMLSHGFLLAGDYALQGKTLEYAETTVQSPPEQRQQSLCGGLKNWFPSHAVFTEQSFVDSIKPNFHATRGFTLRGAKIGVIASNDFHQKEIDSICQNAFKQRWFFYDIFQGKKSDPLQ